MNHLLITTEACYAKLVTALESFLVNDLPCEQVLPPILGSPTIDQLRNRRLSLEPGRHFRFRLETVTLGRSDLSMVVTDQKHDEQFFHEGSHV